jgi:glycosyltransferase involved in cell wall biosynthesis
LVTVLAQDLTDLELIVVDDGTLPGTGQVVSDLRDRRARVVRSGEKGVSVARNEGGAEAKGTWLAFCDDDDLWHPSKLSSQLAALQASGRQWAYCSALRVTDDLEPVGASLASAEGLQRKFELNPVPGGGSSVVVHAELFRQSGGFDPDLAYFAGNYSGVHHRGGGLR